MSGAEDQRFTRFETEFAEQLQGSCSLNAQAKERRSRREVRSDHQASPTSTEQPSGQYVSSASDIRLESAVAWGRSKVTCLQLVETWSVANSERSLTSSDCCRPFPPRRSPGPVKSACAAQWRRACAGDAQGWFVCITLVRMTDSPSSSLLSCTAFGSLVHVFL